MMTTASGEWTLKVSRAERITWRVQRAGWVVMGLVVILALAGLLGAGPAAQREATGTHHAVAWQGISRLGAPEEVQFRVWTGADSVRITIGDVLVETHKDIHWSPEPARSYATARGQQSVFALIPGDTTRIALHWQPAHVGRVTGRVMVDNMSQRMQKVILP